MRLDAVDEANFCEAEAVYTSSWRASHQHICTQEFLRNRDCAEYLREKMGCFFLLYDTIPVGVFSLNGEDFGDLYIHPNYQGKGYGKACIAYASAMSPVLRLSVLSNNTRAISLYKSMGFRFTGRELPLKHELYEREMVLENTNLEIIQSGRWGHDPTLQDGLE